MEVRLRREAELEVEETSLWYERGHPGRGRRFLSALSETFRRIEKSDDTFPAWGRTADLRHTVVRDLPFKVIFRQSPEAILVFAVIPDEQRSLYRRNRTKA